MPKLPRVKLLKQVKQSQDGRWKLATALFDSKGRIRRDRVRIHGYDEAHPKGSSLSNGGTTGSAIGKPRARTRRTPPTRPVSNRLS